MVLFCTGESPVLYVCLRTQHMTVTSLYEMILGQRRELATQLTRIGQMQVEIDRLKASVVKWRGVAEGVGLEPTMPKQHLSRVPGLPMPKPSNGARARSRTGMTGVSGF
jgi:hypothetical protein